MSRTECTSFQRGNPNSQQAHEKMLNITNHYRNANQNHNILPHTCQNHYHQKKIQIINVGEAAQKSEPSYIAGGIITGAVTVEKRMKISQKPINRTML